MMFIRTFLVCATLGLALSHARAANFSADDVRRIISTYGPIMKLHPGEEYKMDDPSEFLKSKQNEIWGAVIPDDNSYCNLNSGSVYCAATPTQSFYTKLKKYNVDSNVIDQYDAKSLYPDIYNDKKFKMFLALCTRTTDYDACIRGKQTRAKSLISVNEGGNALFLTFWFFYPFNGPGRAFAGPIDDKNEEQGRHYGDWEHVTLRVVKGQSGAFDLDGIYLSRHSFSPWYNDLSRFSFRDKHPIIYIAINSHAHYPSGKASGTDWVYATRAGGYLKVYDSTRDGGDEFDTSDASKRVILSSNVPGLSADPVGYYDFPYDWGQFLANATTFFGIKVPNLEVNSGPSAPVTKDPDQAVFTGRSDALVFGNPDQPANIEVFGLSIGLDGYCCHVQHTYLSDWTWAEWADNFQGAPQATNLATAADGNVTHVFAVTREGRKIAHNWFDGRNWRPSWSTDLSIVEGVDLVSGGYSTRTDGTRQLELFSIRHTDGSLIHNTLYGGGWTGWYPDFNGAPRDVKSITTVRTYGNLLVLAVRADGSIIWTRYDNGTWTGWSTISGMPSVVSLAAAGESYTEVLATGTDGKLYHLYYQGDGNWFPTSGVFRGFTGNVRSMTIVQGRFRNGQGGHIEAFILDDSGKLYHNWKDDKGEWHAWVTTDLPAQPRSFLTIKAAQHQNIELFAIDSSNNIAHIWMNTWGNSYGWGKWEILGYDTSADLQPN